jgi:ubiquinone/menaquinone biosynthesis C-methylase UbiE
VIQGESQVKTEWYETFFEGVAMDFWAAVMQPAMTSQDADFLVRALNVPSGAKVLDIACGHGRHANELARRGYLVTGVDLSDDCLKRARSSATPGAEFVKGDMRDLQAPGRYAGAYCFGNSLPYLNHDQLGALLQRVAKLLEPGGRFVIEEGATAESLLPNLLQKRWLRAGDIVFMSENRYVPAASRLDIDYTFIKDGHSETRPSSSYVLTTGEICGLFEKAGFEVLELASGFAGEPYQLGSPRLLLTARTLVVDV